MYGACVASACAYAKPVLAGGSERLRDEVLRASCAVCSSQHRQRVRARRCAQVCGVP